MTTEQKAKAYDEALQRARELNSGKDVDVEAGITTCEYIFPELKDSENERIRKESCKDIRTFIPNEKANKYIAWPEKQKDYIKFPNSAYTSNRDVVEFADKYSHAVWEDLMNNFKKIENYSIGCNDVSDIVLNAIINTYNWLEKRGPIDKDKLAKGFLRSVATTIMQYLDSNTAEGKMCLSNMECEDIENAVFNADWAKVYRYMKKKLEKQGKQHPHVDVNKMVDKFAHTEVKGYGNPSMIEVDAYRRGIEDALKYCLTTIQIYERDKNSKTT